MSWKHQAAMAAASLAGGVGVFYAWLTLPVLSPWSERLWTWLNRLAGGGPPGFASDIEFLLVFAIGTLATACLVVLACRMVSRGNPGRGD